MAAPVGNRHRSKYNEKVHETIVEAVLKGNSKTIAFRLAGVHPDSCFLWLKMGRERPDEYPEYAKLEEDIEHAIALCASEKVAAVKAAADNGTWQAAAWWLERRLPQEYGRHDRVEVESKQPQVQLNQVIIGDPRALESSRDLIAHLTSGRPAIPEHVGDAGDDAQG